MDNPENSLERAKKLWKQRREAVELDRRDFRISKNIASGSGISDKARNAYGKDRAIVNIPILDPAVNAIAYRFDSNPFTFTIPESLKSFVDENELLAALSKSLREICWDGISYLLVYHEGQKIKFRVLDNLNVVWGRCRLASGEDCKEALYVDKISRPEIEELYPGLKPFSLGKRSIIDYSGPVKNRDEYEEITYWEKTESGVKVSKFIGGEPADETVLPLNRLPLIRICGKNVQTDGRENWRGIPYPVRDMLTTLTYMASLLQERVATAPSFNFWVPQESANTQELAKQNAQMNGFPRGTAYYRALDNGQLLPPPTKVDKSAGIEDLSVQIEAFSQKIITYAGAAAAPPQAGTETAESVLLRRESKENATDEFLRNLLIGANGVAAVLEDFFAMLGAEVKIKVTESIFEKAKQAADSQKLAAFVGFITQNPGNMDFAEALLKTLDLSEENAANMQTALAARRQKEQQNVEQLMQQGQMQAMQLQEAQQQAAALQKALQDTQHANMVMEADSQAKVVIKEMELKNQIAIKQMDMELEYAKLGVRAQTDGEKNEIAAARVANEQLNNIDKAMKVAIEHPTKGAFT